jgi:AraC-like DNA-binding protein
VGYDNSSFFRKLFTKHTGLGPKEYQKKFQLADSGPANGARREQNISENRI